MFVRPTMRKEASALPSRPGTPKRPLVTRLQRGEGSAYAGARPWHYKVFISHSGANRRDIGMPLYRDRGDKGMAAFVEKEEQRLDGIQLVAAPPCPQMLRSLSGPRHETEGAEGVSGCRGLRGGWWDEGRGPLLEARVWFEVGEGAGATT